MTDKPKLTKERVEALLEQGLSRKEIAAAHGFHVSRISKILNWEAHKESARRWKKKNPEKVLEHARRWQKKNPEKVREYARRSVVKLRRAAKLVQIQREHNCTLTEAEAMLEATK